MNKNKDNNLIISVIKNRSDFLFVAQGDRASGRFLSLQKCNPKPRAQSPKFTKDYTKDSKEISTGNSPLANGNSPSERNPASGNSQNHSDIALKHIRYGITASKKVGNAVMRNRAKRRLRVLLRSHLPQLGQAGKDYVAIARPQTVVAGWHELEQDFLKILTRLSKSEK